MGKGQELLHRLYEVLDEFEQAIVKREHRKPLLEDKVVLRQAVDDARKKVVETVVQLIKEAEEEYLRR